MRIYWDSCLVIYDVEGAMPFAERLRAAYEAMTDGTVHVSDLVRLECMVVPLRTKHDKLIEAYETRFSTLAKLDMDAATFDLAATLRADHRLKTPDALHAACAIRHRCDELWTNDGRFTAIASRIAIRVLT